ncbi:MAG: hypothetical protein HYS15_03310 [Candidatus Spechtbacteria bacterium]|nr:hypothetical protein [Candidatus Spechtbacteria bacterium]
MSYRNKQGIIALLIVLVTMFIGSALAFASVFVSLNQAKGVKNIAYSYESIYASEAGVEDALLRVLDSTKKLPSTNPYTLLVGNASASTTIGNILGGARTIVSEGSRLGRVRKVGATLVLDTANGSFFFGAEVGDAGLTMQNGSKVNGNVFSNGPVIAGPNTSITGTVRVAKNGNKLKEAVVGKDAQVDICENSTISGVLTVRTNTGCTSASTTLLVGEIATSSLPVTQAQVDGWKSDAASGGTIVGNYTLDGSNQASLGPKKIQGNMEIKNSAKLTITGTLWVTGEITIQNSAQVRLDSSYGSTSGVVVSDDEIILKDESISSGSGQAGSYLLYVSATSKDPALIIQNNAQADILFTLNGWVEVRNNTHVREVTGYGVRLLNNAELTYETGLNNTSFSSGPSAGWSVGSWKETK